MVLTHVAERLHLSPGMGWGLPDSPGHYLDFISAVLGCALLIARRFPPPWTVGVRDLRRIAVDIRRPR
jgi:hypothetical protein